MFAFILDHLDFIYFFIVVPAMLWYFLKYNEHDGRLDEIRKQNWEEQRKLKNR